MSLELLYVSVQRRKRPEDVADLVLRVLGPRLDAGERAMIAVAARGALRHRLGAYTSMLEDFARPVGLSRQVTRAAQLFDGLTPLDADAASDPARVEAFVRAAGAQIQKTFGRNDFMSHRMSREVRASAGLESSRRRYNRKFRVLARMESKLLRHARLLRQHELTRVGKSGLATSLSAEELCRDASTACFIAYYVARSNLRSEFTISGQKRPFDSVAATLFDRCRRSATTDWVSIAHVLPTAEVLSHLTTEEKGTLLARWLELLSEIGRSLHDVWTRSRIADDMTVRRGNDSTTWNQLVRAWNNARDHWIALVIELGMGELFEHYLPGKAVFLIAADVAAWHRSAGHGVHGDVRVFAELPRPWDVVAGRAVCDRALIERVCARHGVDASRGGWTSPRRRDAVVAFTATPELVHGVTVASPFAAAVMKAAGWFSGKGKKEVKAPVDAPSVT